MAATRHHVANLLSTLAPLDARGLAPDWRPHTPRSLRTIMNEALLPLPLDVREIRDGESLTALSPNAPLLSALGFSEFAAGPLEHAGAGEHRVVLPGYYLVEAHEWRHGAPGSPLGAQPVGSRVWVTHQTYKLLRELTHGSRWATAGHWPDCTVFDAWTCGDPVRFVDWSRVLRDLRTSALAGDNPELYDSFREEFLSTVESWMAEGAGGVFRPDWFHTLVSRSAYSLWRCGYIAASMHRPPAAIGADRIVFRTGDLTALMAKVDSPITVDRTGQRWTTYRPVRRYFSGEDMEE